MKKNHVKYPKKKVHTKVILCGSLRLTLRALREKRKVHAKYAKVNLLSEIINYFIQYFDFKVKM